MTPSNEINEDNCMKKTIRHIAHAVVWFPPEAEIHVRRLAKLQSSAIRSAYQAIHKHSLKNNDVRKYVKLHYMADLNQRYINDACLLAAEINHDHTLFGGRSSWRDLVVGKIDKAAWLARRNGQLYSRGDRAKFTNGNPNLRIIDNRLLVNDPTTRGRWIEGKLFLPKRFKPNLSCYDIRLIFKNGKIEVKIGWEELAPEIITSSVNGVIGVDTNPDGCAIVETDHHGNLKRHRYVQADRIKFASKDKREYDVQELAKNVVAKAERAGKPLVIENLKFKQKKKGKKFNRMTSNFLHRKITESIYRRAAKQGVEVKSVNPAFTSILGHLKYEQPLSLNRHTAAALVIGRRGQNFQERQIFTVTPSTTKKNALNLAGRGASIALSPKAWSWLQDCFLKPNLAVLTGPPLVPHEGIRGSTDETSVGESVPITGRYGVEEFLYQADERTTFGVEHQIRVP